MKLVPSPASCTLASTVFSWRSTYSSSLQERFLFKWTSGWLIGKEGLRTEKTKANEEGNKRKTRKRDNIVLCTGEHLCGIRYIGTTSKCGLNSFQNFSEELTIIWCLKTLLPSLIQLFLKSLVLICRTHQHQPNINISRTSLLIPLSVNRQKHQHYD